MDFPKNHDSEHDFTTSTWYPHSKKSCSVFVILNDPDDFREEDVVQESTISRYLSIVLGSLCRPRRHEKEDR